MAARIGINEALVFEQLCFLFDFDRNGRSVNGKRWIYNSYGDWSRQFFPWLSPKTLQRTFGNLIKLGMVECFVPSTGCDRTKHYRPVDNVDNVDLPEPKEDHDYQKPCGQIVQAIGTKSPPLIQRSLTKSKKEEDSDSVATAPPSAEVDSMVETLHNLLRPSKPPLRKSTAQRPSVPRLFQNETVYPYPPPDREVFQTYYETNCPNAFHARPDLYDEMLTAGWTDPKGAPIKHWKAYLDRFEASPRLWKIPTKQNRYRQEPTA